MKTAIKVAVATAAAALLLAVACDTALKRIDAPPPVELVPETGSCEAPADIIPPAGVRGPASSTDNAIARFDGTTGKVLQNSGCTVDDSGNLACSGTVAGSGTLAGSGTVGRPAQFSATSSLNSAAPADGSDTVPTFNFTGDTTGGMWRGTSALSPPTGFPATIIDGGADDEIDLQAGFIETNGAVHIYNASDSLSIQPSQFTFVKTPLEPISGISVQSDGTFTSSAAVNASLDHITLNQIDGGGRAKWSSTSTSTSLTTNLATASVFNTNATTWNAAGDATAVNIATSGSATTLTTIGNASTDTLKLTDAVIASGITVNSNAVHIVLDGATGTTARIRSLDATGGPGQSARLIAGRGSTEQAGGTGVTSGGNGGASAGSNPGGMGGTGTALGGNGGAGSGGQPGGAGGFGGGQGGVGGAGTASAASGAGGVAALYAGLPGAANGGPGHVGGDADIQASDGTGGNVHGNIYVGCCSPDASGFDIFIGGNTSDTGAGGSTTITSQNALAGSAAAGGNTVINGGDGDGAGADGIISIGPSHTTGAVFGTDATWSTGFYPHVQNGSGAPASGDCNAGAEAGRIYFDNSGNTLYTCNGAAWKSILLLGGMEASEAHGLGLLAWPDFIAFVRDAMLISVLALLIVQRRRW